MNKLTAICVVSGEPATRTQRLINGKPANYDDALIYVGANELMSQEQDNVMKLLEKAL